MIPRVLWDTSKHRYSKLVIVIFIILIPRVCMIPRVSWDTVQKRVRYVPVPVTGTVFAGTGTVWKIPTRGVPVTNPIQMFRCSNLRIRLTQSETTCMCLYIFWAQILRRFWIWHLICEIWPMWPAIVIFVSDIVYETWFSSSRCSNWYNVYPWWYVLVPYVWIMIPKRLQHIHKWLQWCSQIKCFSPFTPLQIHPIKNLEAQP